MRKTIALLLALLLAVLCAACTPTNDDSADIVPEPSDAPEQSPQISIQPQKEQRTLVLAARVYFDGYYDPFYTEWFSGNVFECLMGIGENGEYCGVLAENWSVSDDYLTWQFKIKDNVFFSDGTVCDAAAIAESWELLCKDENIMFDGWLKNINVVSWAAKENNVFEIVLSSPCPWMLDKMCCSDMHIISPSAIKLHGVGPALALVGTGPYKVTEASSEKLVLTAFDGYHNENKKAKIEKIELRCDYLNERSKYALLNKDIDGFIFEDSDLCAYLESEFDGSLCTVTRGSNPMWLNAGKVTEFQLKEVRKAISCLIDLEELNEQAFAGYGRVQTGIWADDAPAYVKADVSYDEKLGLDLLSSVGMTPEDISFVHRRMQPEADYTLADALCEQLNAVGVDMSIETLGPEWSFTPLMDGTWAVEFNFSGYGSIMAHVPWSFILGENPLVPMVRQDIYAPELYAAVCGEYDLALNSASWEEYVSHLREVTRLVQEDYAVLPGVTEPYFAAISSDFEGLRLRKVYLVGGSERYVIALNELNFSE